jgi:hypothetical protein
VGVPTATDAAVADPHAVPRLPLLLLSAGNEGDHKLTTSLLLEVAVVALSTSISITITITIRAFLAIIGS